MFTNQRTADKIQVTKGYENMMYYKEPMKAVHQLPMAYSQYHLSPASPIHTGIAGSMGPSSSQQKMSPSMGPVRTGVSPSRNQGNCVQNGLPVSMSQTSSMYNLSQVNPTSARGVSVAYPGSIQSGVSKYSRGSISVGASTSYSGSIQTGAPVSVTHASLERTATNASVRQPGSLHNGVHPSYTQIGSINAGLIVSPAVTYAGSIQTGISSAVSQIRSGRTGVFKLDGSTPTAIHSGNGKHYAQEGLDRPRGQSHFAQFASVHNGLPNTSVYHNSLSTAHPSSASAVRTTQSVQAVSTNQTVPMHSGATSARQVVDIGMHPLNQTGSLSGGIQSSMSHTGVMKTVLPVPKMQCSSVESRSNSCGNRYDSGRPIVPTQHHMRSIQTVSSKPSSYVLSTHAGTVHTGGQYHSVPTTVISSQDSKVSTQVALQYSGYQHEKVNAGQVISLNKSGSEYSPKGHLSSLHARLPVASGRGGSIQTGIPLDLSGLAEDAGPRSSESPLDLSVKTRKRIADTTKGSGFSDRDQSYPPLKKPRQLSENPPRPLDLRSKEQPTRMTPQMAQMYNAIHQAGCTGINKYITPGREVKVQQSYVQQAVPPQMGSTVPVRTDISHVRPNEKQKQMNPEMARSSTSTCSRVDNIALMSPRQHSVKQELNVDFSSPQIVPHYTHYNQPNQHSGEYKAVTCLQSNRYINYGDGTVRIPDSTDGQPRAVFVPHSQWHGKTEFVQKNSKPVQSADMNSIRSALSAKNQIHESQMNVQRNLAVNETQRPVCTNNYQHGIVSNTKPAVRGMSPILASKESSAQAKHSNLCSLLQGPKYANVASISHLSSDSTCPKQQQVRTSVADPTNTYEMRLPISSGHMVRVQNANPLGTMNPAEQRPLPNVPAYDSKRNVHATVLKETCKIEQKSIIHSKDIKASQKASSEKTNSSGVKVNNDNTSVNLSKYSEPLVISIPTAASSLDQSNLPKPVQQSAPKLLSRKRMILNAVKEDEDLRRMITSGSNFSNPNPKSSSEVAFKTPNVSPASPASPKMPILSPQHKLPLPEVSSEHNEPPTLDPPATPIKNRYIHGANTSNVDGTQKSSVSETAIKRYCGKDKTGIFLKGVNCNTVSVDSKSPTLVNSGLARSCVKDDGQVKSNSDRCVRQDVIRRHSLPERPLMYQKNIPVANVAPFVHSGNKSEVFTNQHSDSVHSGNRNSLHLVSNQSGDTVKEQNRDALDDSPKKQPRSPPVKKHSKALQELASENKSKANSPKKPFAKKSSPLRRKSLHLPSSTPTKRSEPKFIATPLKYKLLRASPEFCQEESRRSEGISRQNLRPRPNKKSPKRSPRSNRRSVQMTTRQRRSMLDELANSDGYVSEERKPKAVPKDLLADPALLSREERALRRAILQIDQMENRDESKETLHPARSRRRSISNLNKRAQELKRRAIDGPRRRGRRRIVKYNRNEAYEKELRKEESRKALNRAKRRARLRYEVNREMEQASQEAGEDDDDNDGCWEITNSSSNLRQTLRSGRNKGGLMMKLYWRQSSQEEVIHTRSRRLRTDYGQHSGPDVPSEGTDGGRCRLRGKGKAKGKVVTCEQVLRSENPEYEYEDFTDSEDTLTMDEMGQTGDPFEESSLFPVPPEVKKLAINKNSGETLLHRASRLGYEDVALYCLVSRSVEVNTRDNAGYTPLHECCVRGNIIVARHLLEHGADVNCCSQDGIRPIHDAVENDHLEIVRLLLSSGADPLLATYGGKTPLKIARTKAMTELLKGYLADLNSCDSEDEDTPWEFLGSSSFMDAREEKGFDLFADIPSDPEDDREDVFDVTVTSPVRTFDLRLDSSGRVERCVLVQDALIELNITKDDLKKSRGLRNGMIRLSSEDFISLTRDIVVKVPRPVTLQVELIRLEDFKYLETKTAKLKQKGKGSRPSTPRKIGALTPKKQSTSETVNTDITRYVGGETQQDWSCQKSTKFHNNNNNLMPKQKLCMQKEGISVYSFDEEDDLITQTGQNLPCKKDETNYATKMREQSEYLYSFDKHDALCQSEKPGIFFRRDERNLACKRDGLGALPRNERNLECKRDLQKTFRSFGNSKEEHYRFKVGTVPEDCFDMSSVTANINGSEVIEAASGLQHGTLLS